MDKCRVASACVARLRARHDENFLEHLLRVPGPDAAEPDAEALEAWGAALAARAQALAPAGREHRHRVEADPATGPRLVLECVVDGLAATDIYYQDFFAAGEYRAIQTFARAQDGLLADGARVERGDRSLATADFAEAYEWLLAEARRGQTLQRYKGLGEMNPEQLWETTMQPDARRLLRVDIGDGEAADALFATLMGDEVDERRSFIQANALQAGNIDI